jgi:uncharacterized membrane protein YqjE
MSDNPTGGSMAEPSLGDLVSQLSEQSSRLIRDEMALAKTELQQSVKHAGIGAGLFGGAGFFAVLGVITLVASAVAALSLAVDVWLAALIVAVVLFVIAGIAGLLGKNQVGEAGPPERAIENVKKDIAEVKEHRS